MKAEILAVGTELLMGQIANTNAKFITSKLQEVGMDVYYHTVVGDNKRRLADTLALALKRSDIVIVTGGLGPTKDDLTKETVAEFFGKTLIPDQDCINMIKEFFSQRNRQFTPNNLKQADLPEGSLPLKNRFGTAPGCIVEEDGKAVILLPGPPSEMKPLFEEGVMPWLMEKSGYKIFSKFLNVFGIGESQLEHELMDLIEKQSNPTIALYVNDGVVTIRVTAKCKTEEEGKNLVSPLIKEISTRLGDALFSTDGEGLPDTIGQLLVNKGLTLSVAESCSGGLLASMLIDLPGASQFFERGYITYSNEAKVEDLGVDKRLIDTYGAVSEEVAIAMADGAAKKSDIALSITGIAGPDGGTDEKPVGLVYVGIHTPEKTWATKLDLWGNRTRIRRGSALNALNILRKYLTK